MYSASAQFHTAVFQNSPVERVLFRFADSTIFTNEDIHVGGGIKFMESANLEEDLKIGACPASSLEATIMNYHGLLSGYTFGECEVSLSARTSLLTRDAVNGSVVTVMRYGTNYPIEICGYLNEPYITINGHAPTAQPPFPVYSIVTVGDTVYCISLNGEVWAAAWVDGQTWSELSARTWNDISTDEWDAVQGILVPITDSTFWKNLNETLWNELATTKWSSFIVLPTFNAFMVEKFKRWAAAHRGMSYNSDTLYEFTTAGQIECFEYVKLGKFRMTVPQKKKVNMISTTAYDKMTLFDVDASSFLDDLTYPITLGELFAQLCTFVGVDRATQTFINSTRSFDEAPAQTEGVTAREVLGWIAEAACAFARMTRDGEVELAWFGAEAVSIPMNQYFSIDVAEYSVAVIDKLQILNSESDIGVIIGTGTNGYQIMDNPCLFGETDQQIRTLGVPIYNRLSAFAAFSPVIATAVCDWSIQAGDIISIVLNDVTYSFPIYFQTITWNGTARVSYESTGSESRPVMDAVNRRVFNQNRAMHEIEVTVDGLSSRISNAEGDITTLELFAEGLELSVTNGSTSSILKLMAGSTELSSQNITFTGIVTFESLSTAGATTINGNNITTGTVAANRIDVDDLYVKHLSAADGTFTGTLSGVNGTFSGTLSGANGTFSGSLSAADGTFTNLTGTGYVSLGTRVTIDTSGITLLGDTDSVRIFMNPPTASGGSEARWVSRGSYYSLGIYTSKRADKKDITDISDECSSIIERLRPVYFRFIQDETDSNLSMGFIAEETDMVCKEITSYAPDGTPVGVQYSNITALLVAELQKIQRRLTNLENSIGGIL